MLTDYTADRTDAKTAVIRGVPTYTAHVSSGDSEQHNTWIKSCPAESASVTTPPRRQCSKEEHTNLDVWVGLDLRSDLTSVRAPSR